MIPDILDQLFAVDVAADVPSDPGSASSVQQRAIRALLLLEQHHALHMDLLASIAGVALLMSMIAPGRQSLGAQRIAERPVRSYLIGAAVMVAITVGFSGLSAFGIVPGRSLLGSLAFFAVATGLSTCARALGARVLPEHASLPQTVAGLVALILPLAWPIGLLTTIIAAPLGLGAWLTGRASRAAP